MKQIIGFALGFFLLISACQKSSSTTGGGGGATTGTAGISPADGSLILGSKVITFSFANPMNTASVSLSGTLGSDAATPVWAADSLSFTVSPTVKWTDGVEKTLIVTGTDTSGTAVSATATYDVVECDVYVATTGSDANPGTSGSPKLTVSAAVTTASLSIPSTVCVQEGNYNVTTSISLVSGVSIYGGFDSADWTNLDPTANLTSITDTRTGGGGINTPITPMNASGNMGNIGIGGLTLQAGNGSYTAGFATSNTYFLTITNCIIKGGTGSTRSMGVYLYTDASNTLALKRNEIRGGPAPSTYGAFINSSSATLDSNTIYAGNGANNYGVRATAATSGAITNNTIYGGTGTTAHGLYVDVASSTISGNTVHAGTGSSSSYGGYFSSSVMPYPTITANTFYGGSANNSTGVYIIGPDIILERNKIDGGTATTASVGVHVNGSNPQIRNNLIRGGTATDTAYGFQVSNPYSPIVRNNTISSGTGGTGGGVTNRAAAIFLNGADDPRFENNLLLTEGGNNRYCVYINLLGAGYSLVFSNNSMFDCTTTKLYNPYALCTGNGDGDSNNATCAISDINSAFTAGGNVGDTANFTNFSGADANAGTFADNDWSLLGTTAATLLGGGLDGSANAWGFTNDLLAETRTGNSGTGWTMGAIEYE